MEAGTTMSNPTKISEVAQIRSVVGEMAAALRWAYWELAATSKVFETTEEASEWFARMNHAHTLLALTEDPAVFEAHLLAEEV